MKLIIAILILIILNACSEEQVFDTTFKANERYYLTGYCQKTDSLCVANVDKYIDDCFVESDYDSANFPSNSNIDWSNPQASMKNTDFSKFIQFNKKLNNCMANKIGGSFAKNIVQGNTSWETNVKITRPQSTISNKQSSGDILVAIKSNGDIWINKDIVKLKDIRLVAEQFVLKNGNVNAVIIADRDSSISDVVSVTSQLKAAHINKISIASSKPDTIN